MCVRKVYPLVYFADGNFAYSQIITCADDGFLICAFRTPIVYFYAFFAPLHQLDTSSESVHCILACIHLCMYDHPSAHQLCTSTAYFAPLHQLDTSSESVHCILACIHLCMYDHINIALYNFNQ